MKLYRVDLHNFRLLHEVSVRIGGPDSSTILVGPNNSGKTSVAEALQLMATPAGRDLAISDFSLDCRPQFEPVQQWCEAPEPADENAAPSPPELPTISIKLFLAYSNESPEDLVAATPLLMDLDAASEKVALLVEFALRDLKALREDYLAERDAGESLYDFLSRHLHKHFEFRYFKTDLAGAGKQRLEDAKALKKILHVDFVSAQRHIADQDSGQATRLSKLLHDHYTRRYETDDPAGHQDLKTALKTQSIDLTGKYTKAFAGLFDALAQFGYPQKQSARLKVRAELNAETLFKDTTRVYYEAELPTPDGAIVAPIHELPEKYNGLGFKNLIYMILQVKSFREAFEGWDGVRPRVHLVVVEEPEVHLHPQMQTVFIKEISKFLNPPGAQSQSQLLLTTHSAHIVADSGFAPIRYFRRQGTKAKVRDLLEFKETKEAAGQTEALRFLRQYLTQTRCDLMFCDKIILVEGAVERLLLPLMLKKAAVAPHENLTSDYVSFLEVGGAYAHLFRELLQFLDVPALIITDLDAVGADQKRCAVANGVNTSNATLKTWLPARTTLADLHAATPAQRTSGRIRVTYQIPDGAGQPCGRSFEEAFVYKNSEWLLANRAQLVASSSALTGATAKELCDGAYNACQKIQKVDFALDLMLTDGWDVPKYIADELRWLAEQNA